MDSEQHDAIIQAQLELAETRLRLLALTARLTAESSQLLACGGARAEFDGCAGYAARCLTEPPETRGVAAEMASFAAVEARRLLGADDQLTHKQFVLALELVTDFERLVLARCAVAR